MRWIVDRVLRENGLESTNRSQFIQVETIIAMAEAGLGVAIQPSTRLEKQPLAHARAIPLTEPQIRRTMSLIRLKNRDLSPAAKYLAGKITVEIRRVSEYAADEVLIS
ncbi:LysR substrate-binding domain-containing protein [Neorhizobium sp. DAR64861/K0K2]|uniref:LysR substrate-binding domain-containing protein n=1 Tax=unclassified Neorhizobium TaxID=2629175 RepID=UPI003D2DBB4D